MNPPHKQEPLQQQDGKWNYGGMVFGSEEAARLFIKSRNSTEAENSSHKKRMWLPFVTIGIVAASFITLNSGDKSSPAPLPAPTPKTERIEFTGLTHSQGESFAKLINMNGKLCAELMWALKATENTYEVKCKEYRDPTNESTATYKVNLSSGLVE